MRTCILLVSVVVLGCGWSAALTAQEQVMPMPQPLLPPPGMTFDESEVPVEEIKVKPPPKIWSGSLELGVNGTAGNSELFKGRIGGELQRKTKLHLMKTDFLYSYATANGEETEHRALINGRYERSFGESPWSFFTNGSLFYDEFKDYDIRLTAHAGLGYQWINTDTTMLKTRLGGGGSREIGGPSNRFMPEADLGVDFEHKISKRQKFVATVDYYPDLGDIGEFRVQAKLSYELLIDPDWNLKLRLGVTNNYESDVAPGINSNDIEYFGVLLWGF